MKYFNYKKRNLFSGPHLLGTLLTIAGMFALVSPLILKSGSSIERIIGVGTGAMLIGLLIISSYDGTLIDIAHKRFKAYVSVVGYKLGDWMPLPDILKVKIVSDSYISSNTPNGVSPTLSGEVTDFKVFLYSDSAESILSFEYSKMEKAVQNAERLAAELDAELFFDLPK